MRHLIAYPDISVPAVAQLFLDYIWKLHGLPKTIISNKGHQFVFAFWKELTTWFHIKAVLFTAYYPQMDGQMECVNAVMEQYIWIYTLYL